MNLVICVNRRTLYELFDKDGNSRHDWNIFLDNFPTIGVFKLPHDSNEAYYDKNVASMLHIEGDNMSKDSFYALLDSLNENQIEDYKNIYMYTADGETSYIKSKSYMTRIICSALCRT